MKACNVATVSVASAQLLSLVVMLALGADSDKGKVAHAGFMGLSVLLALVAVYAAVWCA